jgi:AAT family amino acid transporter
VLAILGLIVASIFLLASGIGLSGAHATLSNLWSDGGLFPTGLRGFLASLPIAFFAFGGSELVGLAAGEAEHPERSLPAAINGVIARILIFSIGSLTVVMALIPWRQIVPTESPFVLVFDRIGLPATAAIINLVLISAVLSSCNSGLFAAARTLRSLAAKGHAPRFLAPVDGRGIPVRGISASAALMFGGVVLNYFVPGKVLEYIIASSAVLLMGTWVSIIVSHLAFRAQTRGMAHRFPMPFYPWASWIVLLFIGGIALIMATMLQMYVPIGFVAGFYGLAMILYLLAGRRAAVA